MILGMGTRDFHRETMTMARTSGTVQEVCILPRSCSRTRLTSYCVTGATKALATLPSLSDDLVILMNDMLSATAPNLDNPFGALCAIFLTALTQSFQAQSETADEVNIGVWVYALEQASLILSEHARHRPAMACTLSALQRFVTKLHSTGDVLKAVKAAESSDGVDTDVGAQLLCAFFAGLAGPVNGKIEESSLVAKSEEASGSTAAQDSVGLGLRAEVLDQRLQEESSPIETSENPEQGQTSAEEKQKETPEEGAVSPGVPGPATKVLASGPGLISSLGAALGLTSKETSQKEEAVQPAITDEGQVSEASREAIVDALQIKQSDFDAAMDGIRSREPIPLPSRQMPQTTLLDMVRQQIETLGVSPNKEAAVDKDADEEEYELI